MAIKGQFNMFSLQNDQPEPSKNQAISLFSIKNQNQKKQSQLTSKKKNFVNQIRRQFHQKFKKDKRQSMTKLLASNQLFLTLQKLSCGNEIESKNISNLLIDLRRNINDFQFCKKIDNQSKIKNFILTLYLKNFHQISIRQKILLAESLVYLTYFTNRPLESGQTKDLIIMIKQQLYGIKNYNNQSIEYIQVLIDLLTNVSALQIKSINEEILSSNVLQMISQKIINQVWVSGDIALKQLNDKGLHQQRNQQLEQIRKLFIQTIANLSITEHQNQYFQNLVMKQLINDIFYIHNFTSKTLLILSFLVKSEVFRQKLLGDPNIATWFTTYVFDVAQKRFSPKSKYIKDQKFQGIIMSENQLQSLYRFYDFLLLYLINEQTDSSRNIILDFMCDNINMYCLSEFLIQCASSSYNKSKNSKYVSKAIQIYEQLASQKSFDHQKLLTVTSERDVQDIFKVFINPVYFTSIKISSQTLSFLNKLLSRNEQLLETYIQLRIFQSIREFVCFQQSLQDQNQIENFFDLLTIMVQAEQDIKSIQNRQNNKVVQFIENQIRTKLQNYQQHNTKEVAEKAEAFLTFLSPNGPNQRQNQFQI